MHNEPYQRPDTQNQQYYQESTSQGYHLGGERAPRPFAQTFTGANTSHLGGNNDRYANNRERLIWDAYLKLSIAVCGAFAGGFFFTNTEVGLYMALLPLAFGFLYWIMLVALLNAVPYVALWTANNKPKWTNYVLFLDGIVAAYALSPLLLIAMSKTAQEGDVFSETGLISSALLITGAIFAGIIAYVKTTGNVHRMGMMSGAACMMLFVMIPINYFAQVPFISSLILLGIGLMGAWQLASITSQLHNDPKFNSPDVAALAMFAGLFNIFQVILTLLANRE